ncbi:MAG TPA: hypothetical protein VIH90_01400 [Candidatus Saccharimonadales bacterium]
MGIFRPLVNRSLEIAPSDVEPSDKIVTVATGFTVARPTVLGMTAAYKLATGKKHAHRRVLATGASDAEGNIGRLWDRLFPKSGRGTTEAGAYLDPPADTIAAIEIGVGMLIGPKVSKLGKLATAIVIGHESYKAIWAWGRNKEYKQHSGEMLKIKPTVEGKESMAEKFSAIWLASVTNDMEPGFGKFAVGALALGFAIRGTTRGEGERKVYTQIAAQMITDAKIANEQEQLMASLSAPEFAQIEEVAL